MALLRLWGGAQDAPTGLDRSSVVIRAAGPEDADAIARLSQALSLADAGRPSKLTSDALRRDAFGADPAFHLLVAVSGTTHIGYIGWYPGYDTDTATRGVYISDLYVTEGFRRHGVGRRLMATVAAQCRDDGGRWMFWSVLRRNRQGRRFYRRLARELKGVVLCTAFGKAFDRLADGGEDPNDR